MAIIAALVLLALGSGYALRARQRAIAARWAVKDAAALAQYTLGHSHRSPACAAPYNQSKVAQWQRRENAKAGRARRKSRLAQEGIQDKPVKVTPMRKRA